MRYHSIARAEDPFNLAMKGYVMNSKMSMLVMSVIASTVLWLIGGFVFGKTVGMICVLIGITLVGLAAGNVMNSPAPDDQH